MKRRILVVDDDASIREALFNALTDDRTEVTIAEDAERALAALAASSPHVLLSDVRMPGLDGLELLRLVRERAPDVDVVLMTAFEDMPTVATAMREGAVDFLTKPLDLHDLRRVLERTWEDRRSRARASDVDESAPPAGLGDLVGRDPRMIAIYKTIGQVAAGRASVLVRGESGTGKELIARAIHEMSPNATEPFVAVNCAALPSTLLESELFGHVRGAFTGAISSRRGRFALAGRGTIFLDEIGDTSAEFQAKLLRVLQEREFHPVGAERAERTEARVIAATHRNLERMVAEGGFRADLYYRLRVVEIVVPPLRERPADIARLARHLLARASRAYGYREPVLSRAALDLLLHHDWPGNVRELENALTRALVLASGDVIRPEHLTLGLASAGEVAQLPSLDELERAHVARVLAATGGHKSRTAQILGVSRPRLDRLLAKHGLE